MSEAVVRALRTLGQSVLAAVLVAVVPLVSGSEIDWSAVGTLAGATALTTFASWVQNIVKPYVPQDVRR